MKKTLLLSSLILLISGFGKTPLSTSINAETPPRVAQGSSGSINTNPPLKIIKTGNEPKRKMYFAPAVNSKQNLIMTMNLNMEMSIDGQAIPKVPVPGTRLTMATEVTKIDPNGDIHLDFSYTDADVVADKAYTPEMIKAIRSELKKLVGLKGSLLIDKQGGTKNFNLVLPQEMSPSAKQMYAQISDSIKQISSPLPQEAIGVGATWTSSNSLTINGITMNQTANYEVLDIKNNVITLKLTLEQNANTQNIQIPGLPASANIKLKSLNSQGQGALRINLDQIMPANGNIFVTSNSAFSLKNPNTQQDSTMSMKSSALINFESK